MYIAAVIEAASANNVPREISRFYSTLRDPLCGEVTERIALAPNHILHFSQLLIGNGSMKGGLDEVKASKILNVLDLIYFEFAACE